MPVKIRPSGAPKWCACPAYPTMAARFPSKDKDRQAAINGRAIHNLSAYGLKTAGADLRDYIGRSFSGGTFTEEMVEIARFYVNAVLSRPHGGRPFLLVEHPVDCGAILQGMTGTEDCSWIEGNKLVIAELKTGVVPVHPEHNPQMACYTPHLLSLAPSTITEVEFIVIQPMRYDGRPAVCSWVEEVSVFKILSLSVRSKAAIAASDNPTCDPSHLRPCTECPGKHDCKALQAYSFEKLYPLRYLEQTPALIAAELANLEEAEKVIKTRKTALEEIGKTFDYIPGYTKGRGKPSKKWKYADEIVVSIGNLHNINLKVKKVPTPLQAKKLGMPDSVVDALTEEVPGEEKLKPVNIEKAKRIFENG